jgi:hypothetical protein
MEVRKKKGKKETKDESRSRKIAHAGLPKALEIHINIRGKEVKKKSGPFISLSLFLPFEWGPHGTGGQWRREFSPKVCKHRHYPHTDTGSYSKCFSGNLYQLVYE